MQSLRLYVLHVHWYSPHFHVPPFRRLPICKDVVAFDTRWYLERYTCIYPLVLHSYYAVWKFCAESCDLEFSFSIFLFFYCFAFLCFFEFFMVRIYLLFLCVSFNLTDFWGITCFTLYLQHLVSFDILLYTEFKYSLCGTRHVSIVTMQRNLLKKVRLLWARTPLCFAKNFVLET